ncbi:MAG: NADH-quinone oxidoreductase subunit C [Deltaproteobacteria bacterium]|nr:NADH-quinone oxidoreductase subunit C [Deltaproteobacteria bacterium]
MKDYALVITEDNTAEIATDKVISQIRILKDEGFRFVTMSSADLGESVCVVYHMDKDLELVNLKVDVPKGKTIPSIASVFSCAFLVENEIKEHFGVDFDGLPLDFQGMLYNDEEVQRTPFCKIGITRI